MITRKELVDNVRSGKWIVCPIGKLGNPGKPELFTQEEVDYILNSSDQEFQNALNQLGAYKHWGIYDAISGCPAIVVT